MTLEGSCIGSDAFLVQLSSFSFGADQSGLKQIDFAATIHLTSDQFEASDPPLSVRSTKAALIEQVLPRVEARWPRRPKTSDR